MKVKRWMELQIREMEGNLGWCHTIHHRLINLKARGPSHEADTETSWRGSCYEEFKGAMCLFSLQDQLLFSSSARLLPPLPLKRHPSLQWDREGGTTEIERHCYLKATDSGALLVKNKTTWIHHRQASACAHTDTHADSLHICINNLLIQTNMNDD